MYTPSLSTRITLLALLSASTFYFIYKSRRRCLKNLKLPFSLKHSPNPNPKLFFISQTGTSKTLAQRLLSLLTSNSLHFDLVDPQNYEPEDLSKETLVLIVASTWEDGKPPQNGQFFANWLSESADDFRVGSLLLSRCRFAVFGIGSGAYGDRFNAVGKELSKKMRALGGIEILPVCSGDVDRSDIDNVFDDWSKRVIRVLCDEGVGVECEVSDDFGDSVEEFGSDESEDEGQNGAESVEVVDLEDIAGKAPSRKSNGVVEVSGKRDMVTPVIRASLEKQGYKIIGSHSGVKICRWTKSQLRGRGGCYKHSFYGIESHRIWSIKLYSIRPSIKLNDTKSDRLRWKHSRFEEYTIKSGYGFLNLPGPSVPWQRVVWNKTSLPRHAFILWLAWLGKLSTLERVHRWGLVQSTTCLLCNRHQEDYSHLFFQCDYTSQVWSIVCDYMHCLVQSNNWDNVTRFLMALEDSPTHKRWRATLAAAVYCIWRTRNQVLLGTDLPGISRLANHIRAYIRPL